MEDEIEQRVRADIERFGWHLALFPPSEPPAPAVPGWAHSIGLHARFEQPEIVVFGSQLDLIRSLLDELCTRVRAGARYAADSQVEDVLTGFPIAFRGVDARWADAFLGNAAWFYRSPDFPRIQCFWPDRDGRFPWDAACDPEWRADQPLLYEADPERALSPALMADLEGEGAL
jgi:hypothetical protein